MGAESGAGAALGPIARRLAAQPVLLLDGALATELERRGADLADPLWSARCLIEQPELIRAVHLDYFEAGADIATTATYQASFEGFARRGIDRAAGARLMRRAVELAAAAREEFGARASAPQDRPRPLIAASVGPYGAMRADGSEYRGDYGASDAALAAFHGPRLDVLAEAGADLIGCETIPCLQEALVLARLLEQYPHLTAWLCFSCRNGAENCAGEAIDDCVRSLERCGQIEAVGVNCTAPEHIASLLERMRGASLKPLIAYPNSGERYDAASKSWSHDYSGPPLAARARDWRDAGARIVGGCCRTGPADIAALRAVLSAP